MSTNTRKGVARNNTLVIKILEFRSAWLNKEPDQDKRALACRRAGTTWSKFSARCAPSNVKNGRTNISKEHYSKYCQASGLNPADYIDSEACPADYITTYFNLRQTSVSKSDTAKKFTLVSTPSSVEIFKKMLSFRSHIGLYQTSLHLSEAYVNRTSGISHYSDYLNCERDLTIEDYIILSNYFVTTYISYKFDHPDYADTFYKIAELFNDIYRETLYFSDDTSMSIT